MSKLILIDGYYLGRKQRGMAGFVDNMLRQHEGNALLLISDESMSLRYPNSVYIPKLPYPIWEQFILPWYCKKLRADILISPFNTAPVLLPKSTKRAVVIHDIIFTDILMLFKHGTILQIIGQLYRNLVLKMIHEKIDIIFTVSETSRIAISQYYKKNRNNIHILNNLPQDVQATYEMSDLYSKHKPFLLSITGTAANKNLKYLLKSYASTKASENYNLLLLGIKEREKKVVEKLVSSLNLTNKVIVTSYLSKSEVMGLLERCVLMLVPSTSEGYGIPVLEGLVHSKVTVCSDIPIFREIADSYAHFFDLSDPNSLSEIIDNLILNMPQKLEKFDYESYTADVKEQRKAIWERLYEL